MKAKTVCKNGSLAELFFPFFPLSLVQTVVKQTQQRGMEDWVHNVDSADSRNDDSSGGDESDGSNNNDCVEDCVDNAGGDKSDVESASNNSASSGGSNMDSVSSTGSKIDSASKKKRATKLVPCKKDSRNARHGWIRNWIPVTTGFVIVWLGATLMLGAIGLRSADMMFLTQHNTNIPCVQNTSGRDTFQHIPQFIHFAVNRLVQLAASLLRTGRRSA